MPDDLIKKDGLFNEDSSTKEDGSTRVDSPIKYAIKSFAINILAGLVIFAPLLFLRGDAMTSWLFVPLVVGPLSLFIQLIVGIAYAASANEKRRNMGKGMLLVVGLFFLIGLSVCGPMWWGRNF